MKKKFPAVSLVLLAVLVIETIVSALMLSNYDSAKGITCLVLSALTAAFCIAEIFFFAGNTIKHVSRMNEHLENSISEYINSVDEPVAVIDSEQQLIWCNTAFSEKISGNRNIYGTDIGSLADVNIENIISAGTGICTIGGSTYRISSDKYSENDVSLNILFFRDETNYTTLKKKFDETHPNVVIIMVDNYDEILQNAKESEKSQASVEVEKLIENFMSSTNGFVRKSGSNTFYAVIENKHLDEIITGKFNILDLARNIKIAGKYPLTFSIGVGKGAESLAESEQIAKQCLDMALGRGGDQAVLKTDGGYQFFGGVSQGMEKKSRAKTRILANALQDIIISSDKIFMMGHRFGDLDSVGASCGMAGAVRLLGKEAHIAVNRSANLATNLIDLTEERTDNELFISPENAISLISERDLLIIVDTHSRDVLESPELYDKAKSVVVIDHHRKKAGFINNAVIFHHEPYASSASEMVTEIIQYFSFPPEEVLPPCHADALLAGIMLDTKNFVMRTGVRTFEAAAFLKKLGADTVGVKLLFSGSIDLYRRKAKIVSSAEIYDNFAIAAADFESDDIRLAAPQAADELLCISGVEASFVLYKTGNTVNVSARSFGSVNVQVIMEKLGGGGHQTMAATQIKDKSAAEVIDILKSAINETDYSGNN
ncbi:MAG: DHH family phosphoesterase [Muribaculaceae bacterium]|nr:DHH family phosphoesterase [Alistipes senegalensis]MCM1473878.1 DHH family phosphoesterase [Muribaculaceae bacterium]